MKNDFDKKVVIITGSSMGIGKSLAKRLGSYGARLVLNGRNEEKLVATEKELKDLGYETLSVPGDITIEADCRNLIVNTLQRFGRIDVLVNNAGVSMRGTIGQLSPSVMATVFNTNTIGPIMLTQMALPYIRQSKGSIVFISSLAGLRGLPFISVYSAAKMALTAIVEALRVESKADDIHVGLVHVGYTEVEPGKTTIGVDGKLITLDKRKGFFTSTSETVAKKIAINISKRRSRTVIGVPGKLFDFLVRFLPGILEMAVLRSYGRMKKIYQ